MFIFTGIRTLIQLFELREIYCYKTAVSDLSFLTQLKSLEIINCNETPVIDLSPLFDLPKIREIYCQNTAVSDLSSLTQLKSLEIVNFGETKVSDLSPLSDLTKLREIHCYKTAVSDISPLKQLSSLEIFNCGETHVSDLSSLSNLFELREIYCYKTAVGNLSFLIKLSILEVIYCWETPISDLSPVMNLAGLKRINFYKTAISELSALSKLTALEVVNFGETSVVDICPLTNLSKLKEVYFHKTAVTELSSLSQLDSLEIIYCWDTPVSDLSSLNSLFKLREINCYKTSVKELSALKLLQSLEILDCGETSIEDLKPLIGLYRLEEIHFHNTKINDLSPLKNLTALKVVNCWETEVSDLSPLTGFTKLRKIDCDDTAVSDLSPLKHLSEVEVINCSETLVTDLSPLANLSKLREIRCRKTSICDFPSLKRLNNLEIVCCSDTKVVDITTLKDCPNLKEIDCARTLVNDLTGILNWLEKPDSKLNVEGCPLIIPPIEFANAGKKSIIEYFDQIKKQKQPLNQIKVIFLGDGAAGKTSLIKRLQNEEFDKNEGQTRGIKIHNKDYKIEGDKVSTRLWDFGGQEVMHATHQFFLSQRCIYILLLNSRTDEKAEYWLKHASSFGGKSPVLVVLNKIDENPSFDVNRKALLDKYKQIHGFYRVSCKTSEGLKEFNKALYDQLAQAETRLTPFPTTWASVKDRFGNMKENFVESNVFRGICNECGVDKKFSQDVLLQFLHDLGIVINFKALRQFDTQILDPAWLTNGVYRVINSKLIAENKGLFYGDDFDRVINNSGESLIYDNDSFDYSPNKQHYIVNVMQEFELCFPLDKERYIVPQLLPVQESEYTFEGITLHFIIKFPEFLPESIFLRLMVKLHDYILEDLQWRTGMVLSRPNIFDATARVRADREDREIRIDVCGEEPRRFLSFIRETLKEIITGFPKLVFSEMVPVPESDEFIPYQELVALEEANQKEHFIWKVNRCVKVSDLLDGVEESSMRDETLRTPVKAFISYSHEDKDGLKKLRSALSPLERINKLEIWDDQAIDGGMPWEKEIFGQLQEADIVLCLVSADFIKSDFCHERELEKALKSHNDGTQIVVPIQLRECFWDDLPITQRQGVPGYWINSSKNEDQALTDVSRKLKVIIENIQKKKNKSKSGFEDSYLMEKESYSSDESRAKSERDSSE